MATRMTAQEALTGIKRMLSAYPQTAAETTQGYLMTLAEVLCHYPLEVATAACSPIHGVPKECKSFRPTAGQVDEWCERETLLLFKRSAKPQSTRLPPPPADMQPREERPTVEQLMARVKKVVGHEIGHHPEDAERDEEERKRRGAQVDKANEVLAKDFIPVGTMDGKPLLGTLALASSRACRPWGAED